jgi:hypothetical protein
MINIGQEQVQEELKQLIRKLEELAAQADGYAAKQASHEEEGKRWASLATELRVLATVAASNLVDVTSG